MLDAYEASFRQLVVREKAGQRRIPLWLPDLARRLPVRLSSLHPIEAVCLCDMRIDMDHNYAREILSMRLLVQRGWSVETSLKMYKNFRFMYPQLRFSLASHKVMNRAALREEYGPTFGDLMADIAMDPDSQPIIDALLSGDLQTMRYRPMMETVLRFGFDVNMLLPGVQLLPPSLQLDFELWYRSGPGTGFAPDNPPASLSHSEASEIYYKATGMHPNFTFVIDPMELDYSELADAPDPVR